MPEIAYASNPIRKTFVPANQSHGRVAYSEPRKCWLAVCPHCGDQVIHHCGYPYYTDATRKNTKDALYRHIQQEHKPGSVDR